MMPVYISADNIVSPLGTTTEANFKELLKGNSGIRRHELTAIHHQPFHASLMPGSFKTENGNTYTKFERMLIQSISTALNSCDIDITSRDTGMIIATTKGNISLLESAPLQKHKLPLHYSAQTIADHFGCINEPIIISNACISGLSALITAKRMIESGRYRSMIVAGADTISSFVFSGFNAFQAISPQPCRPFDANRNGITLGEAAATIILSSEPNSGIRLTGVSGSNDANHISGPSRTGEELSIAMSKAIKAAGLSPNDIDYISAHGTATLYNDEMESKAITLAGLGTVPVNSLKGYYGHTLGAAGILESVIAIQSMKSNTILPTRGFERTGVSRPIQVSGKIEKATIKNCLKTASGFGGCNAAIIFSN